MKLHFPDGKGGVNTIEVSDNISLYIENLLEDWTLETASESVKGGIKVGNGLYMDGDSLNAKQYTLLPATKDSLGGVMVGNGLSITGDGELSVIFPSLPTASTTTKGGVKVGNGLYMTGDSLNANSLPVATTESLGGVIIGDGLSIESGVVSVEFPSLPTATRESLGGVIVGDGLDVNIRTGKISVDFPDTPIATVDELGVIKVGDGLSITESGKLSAKIPSLSAATYESVTGASIGGVMIGEGLTINRRGVLSADIPDISIATEDELGVIKVGDGLNIDKHGELSAKGYTLPTADTSVKGGIMVGNGLAMNGDSLDVTIQPTNNYNYTVDGSGGGLVTLQPVLVENNYSLPTANKTRLGGIKVGNGLEINSVSGVLSATGYTLYPATKGTLGGIIVGTGLNVDDYGVLDVTLPTASTTKKGAIIVGEGLEMIGETLTVTITPENNYYYTLDGGEGLVTLQPVYIENSYVLPPATRESLGGVIIGNGLTIDSGGVVSAETYALPTASETVKGGIKIGDGLTMIGESLYADAYDLPTASNVTKGGIKVGGGLTMIGEFLSVDREELPIATRDSLGCVIVGQGLEITENGVLSCNISESTVESMVAEFTGASGEYVSKGSNVIILAADQDFDFSDSEWYCYYRSQHSYGYLYDLTIDDLVVPTEDTGSGEFVLPAEYMDLDFVVRGDDNKLVSVLGVLYDESAVDYVNLATRKQLKDGKCVIPFNATILNNALSQRKIVAEYGTVSEMGNVVFKGTVSSLPESPKHGWLCYKSDDSKLHIYDGTAKKWRAWICNV